MPRLKRNEPCPLHRGQRDCCGRGGITIASKRKSRAYTMIAPGVRRFPDGRERCSPSALKKRKDALIRQGEPCAFCGREFTDYRDVELCHRISKGIGGSRHDDRAENLTLGHRVSNFDCGSRSIEDYIALIRGAGKRFPCEVGQ